MRKASMGIRSFLMIDIPVCCVRALWFLMGEERRRKLGYPEGRETCVKNALFGGETFSPFACVYIDPGVLSISSVNRNTPAANAEKC